MNAIINRRTVLAYVLIAVPVFVIGILFALHIAPTYMTDALLIPKEQSGGPQISGGLATATKLLGINPISTDTNFSKFQKFWASRDVAQRLIDKNPTLLPRLFRWNWDAAHHKWYDRPHVFSQYVAIPLDWLFGLYPNYKPTAEDLATYIKTAMPIDEDQLGTQVQISYKADDARFAQWFLGAVISETDAAVRDAEQHRDRDFISFASNRLARETNVEYRDALTNSLTQFEISSTYSEAGDNYSFQYVEPPDLPVNHISPRPLTDTVLAFLFANLVAAAAIGAMALWPSSRFARTAWGIYDRMFPARNRSVGMSSFQGAYPESGNKSSRRTV